MPRPNIQDERRAEILSAYGRCIARYGVDGATLEKTAEEAGLARALIRHNVGNKEDLLEAFLDHFLGGATDATDSFIAGLPQRDRISTMIEWLFDPDYSDPQEVRITNALITAAIEHPGLAERLMFWTSDFIEKISHELSDAYPEADGDQTAAVAAGIAGIYFNIDTLAPLGGTTQLRRRSEIAAHLLVSTLEQER